MTKKRKVPSAVQAKAEPDKPNPFELKKAKRNFAVLGKRDKTDKLNVIKSREAAQTKRKKTLLVEYKQLRKANSFIDRRFGEGDPGMDEEDRALARLTAQRVKEAKKKSKFSLSEGAPEESLTHGGVSLEQLEQLAALPSEALGDLDEEEGLLRDIMQEYNFGGGEEDGGGEQGAAGRKTRKQVMEEIIAKSKMYKAQKAREREADEEQLEALDSAFAQLVKGPGLGTLVKPAGYDKKHKVAPDNEQDAAYDRAARELVFEAKAHAVDRVLTPEELAAKEAERLSVLEKERLKRMRGDTTEPAGDGGDDLGDDFGPSGDATAAQGGYAAKRRRMAEAAAAAERRRGGGDDDEDEFEMDGSGSESESGEDEGGMSALDRRRQERAAGDHPLQQQFRVLAERLAAKHGVKVQKQQGEQEVHSGDEDEDEEEDEEEDEGESGSEEEEGEDADAADGDGQLSDSEHLLSGEGEEEESDEPGSAGSEEEAAEAAGEGGRSTAAAAAPTGTTKQQQQQQQQPSKPSAPAATPAAAAAAAAEGHRVELEGPVDLPYTIPVPSSYQQFAELVQARPADQLLLVIQRIRAFNAAALASDSKRQLQLLYGYLVQHYAVLAGQAPLPMAHLDALFGQLLTMVKEVPYYGATVARARLQKMQERLAAAAADPLGAAYRGWPAARQLLQLRLFSCQFPVSDRRHPVVTPLVLYLGKALVQCPVTHPVEAALGTLAAGVLLGIVLPAQRYAPEVYLYLAQVLQGYVPLAASPAQQQQQGSTSTSSTAVQPVSDQQVPSLVTPGVLAFSGTSTAAAAAGDGSSNLLKGGKKQQKRKQQGAQCNGHAATNGSSSSSNSSIAPLGLASVLSLPPGAASAESDAFKLQLLGTIVATASKAATAAVASCGPALPPVLQPLLSAAAAVAGVQGLPPQAVATVAQLQQQLQQLVTACVSKRVPLVQSHRVAVPLAREFNPQFEDDYVAGRDYDPDRTRAAARKLSRQVAKEKRGAMRELRKDAAFMAQVRDSERAQVDSERLASERKFYSELQSQEADMRSGGQRGINPHRKKKK